MRILLKKECYFVKMLYMIILTLEKTAKCKACVMAICLSIFFMVQPHRGQGYKHGTAGPDGSLTKALSPPRDPKRPQHVVRGHVVLLWGDSHGSTVHQPLSHSMVAATQSCQLCLGNYYL